MTESTGSTGTDRAPSPAVDRALTVLETLVAADSPLTLTALAQTTGIPLATCAAIMQTLEMRGYAARRVVGRSHFWRPTLRLNGLAAQLLKKIDLSVLVQPFLRELVSRVGMPAHVGVLEGASVVYIAKVAAPGIVQFDTHPGKMAPFNLTALGRAIAAHLPAERLEPLLDNLVKGNGPKAGPADPAAFRAALGQVRGRGYAVEDEEEEAGIGCVAAPFFDAEGDVVGAIGVTGFAKDLAGRARTGVAEIVVEQARSLSRELVSGAVVHH